MAAPAATLEPRPAPKPKRRRTRHPPLVYVVEVDPVEPDPKAAAKVLAWLARRMG